MQPRNEILLTISYKKRLHRPPRDHRDSFRMMRPWRPNGCVFGRAMHLEFSAPVSSWIPRRRALTRCISLQAFSLFNIVTGKAEGEEGKGERERGGSRGRERGEGGEREREERERREREREREKLTVSLARILDQHT